MASDIVATVTPHVPGEVADRYRVHFVQVVEDARLVRADVLACLRVAHVPRVTGEVDPRIRIEEPADVKIAYFTFLCQTKR